MPSTFERLSAILIKHNKLTPEILRPEATLEELKIDSLSLIELLFNVEDEFKVTLPSEDVKLATIADVVRYIDELVAAQHGTAAPVSMTALPAAPAP